MKRTCILWTIRQTLAEKGIYEKNALHMHRKCAIMRPISEKFDHVGGINMKVSNITNVEKFFEVVDSCAGKVELVTGEGDRLNLKSKLSQYVSLANIFSNGEIPEMEILASEKEDIDKLLNFMMNN